MTSLNPSSETRLGVGGGEKSSGLTFALRLFGGSTGHGRGRRHQCPILGQGLGPLLALGGFNGLEFSGMFVAFIMCFGLVLGWGGHRVTIHSESTCPIHKLALDLGQVRGRQGLGHTRRESLSLPSSSQYVHGPRFTERILIRELPGQQPLALNSDSATE